MNPFAHRNLPRLLLHARETVLAHFRPALRSHGLTDQQWRVLRVLAELGPSDVSTIAQEAFLLGPSLTGVLARMERDGLILRDRDAQDARRQIVRASPAGQRLARRLAQSIEAHYSRMEEALGQTQLRQLYDLLDQVITMPAQETQTESARKRRKNTT